MKDYHKKRKKLRETRISAERNSAKRIILPREEIMSFDEIIEMIRDDFLNNPHLYVEKRNEQIFKFRFI
ncbi:MAG: hypothetical protein AAGK97_18825, partial [Bacteroidota bacterium]